MENIIKLFSDKVALGILHMRIWFNRLENRMRENEYLCADVSENGSSCKAVSYTHLTLPTNSLV